MKDRIMRSIASGIDEAKERKHREEAEELMSEGEEKYDIGPVIEDPDASTEVRGMAARLLGESTKEDMIRDQEMESIRSEKIKRAIEALNRIKGKGRE